MAINWVSPWSATPWEADHLRLAYQREDAAVWQVENPWGTPCLENDLHGKKHMYDHH